VRRRSLESPEARTLVGSSPERPITSAIESKNGATTPTVVPSHTPNLVNLRAICAVRNGPFVDSYQKKVVYEFDRVVSA